MTKAAPVVGILAHHIRPLAATLAVHLALEFERRGAVVRVPASEAKVDGLHRWSCPDEEFPVGMSVALSLGGDGTMLRTVDLVVDHDVPVLGINIGHLGYLTAIQPEEIEAHIDDLMSGRFLVEQRMTLAVHVVDGMGTPVRVYTALNEAVLEKSVAGNTVRLGVALNGVPFTDYSADGLIVATPTGSTAYAFSSRGPVVSPLLRAMVVVPVAAHMLFDRSLVLDPGEEVTVRVHDGRLASLFVDGRACGEVSEGSTVRVVEGPRPARLVTFGLRDFHQILRAKFGLATPRPWDAEPETPEGGTTTC